MATVPGCWVCARSGIPALATNWRQDGERFWRCSYGHLANIEQVKQLNQLKEEEASKKDTK